LPVRAKMPCFRPGSHTSCPKFFTVTTVDYYRAGICLVDWSMDLICRITSYLYEWIRNVGIAKKDIHVQ
jgi:hypothetical protein